MLLPTSYLRPLWLAILSTAMAGHAAAAVIDLKPSAALKGGLVRLGEIAGIDDADPAVQRQLAAVSLGPSPAPGRKLRLTQQTIRERLLAHGVNLSEIEFTGQSVVIIETPAESKTGQEPQGPAPLPRAISVRPMAVSPSQRSRADRTMQQAFHRHYRTAASGIGPLKLVLDIPDRDIPALLAVDPELVRFVEPGLEWGGPQTLTAQFPLADGATHIVKMQAWLNETPRILSVKHSVPKGKVIQTHDLEEIPAKEGQTGYANAEELVGQEASRALRPGAALQPGDVTKVPLVRSNDLVTVKVRLPGLTVSRVLRASGSGAAGDLIHLVSLENPQEKLQARVTGWHEAEIVAPVLTGPQDSSTFAGSRSRRRHMTAPTGNPVEGETP